MMSLPVRVATTDGMSTGKRHNLLVIEPHPIEDLLCMEWLDSTGE